MKKIKYGLRKEVRDTRKNQKNQKKLKIKNGFDPTDQKIVIVEKSNVVKFLIKMIARCIKIIIFILFIVLAFIGLISLIYPGPRKELINITNDVVCEVQQYIPGGEEDE